MFYYLLGFFFALMPLPLLYSVETKGSSSQEEALFVRRILEFCKDKETEIVRSQISLFLKKYPQSTFSDRLLMLLGDLEYSQGHYSDAAWAYQKISSSDYRNQTLSNYLESLYRIKKWKELAEVSRACASAEISTFLENGEVLRGAYYFAEAMRQQAKANQDEAKTKWYYEASKQVFEKLTSTSYREQAIIRLAEIHEALKNPKHAVELYQHLLHSSSYAKEEVLFKIAQNQALYDAEESLSTFSQIAEIKGQRSADAIENRLFLLFESGKYQEIVDKQQEFRTCVDVHRLPLVDLFVGRSFFALGHFQKTLDTLTPHLSESYALSPVQHKMALLTLIACAAHLHQIADTEKWSEQFNQHFPHDRDHAKVLYFQAIANKNGGQLEAADHYLEQIRQEWPFYERMDAVYFEKLILLYKHNRWSDCRHALLTFLQDFPQSPQRSHAYHYLIQTTLKQIEEAQGNKNDVELLKVQLCHDLNQAISTAENQDQKATYVLHLAKTLYHLKDYSSAIEWLEKFVLDFPHSKQLYQAHFLLAISFQEGFQNREEFIKNAEKAFILNSTFPEAKELSLNLFSIYLQLAKENANFQDIYTQYTAKAAESLFQAMEQGAQIKQEYLIWLAKNDFSYLKRECAEEKALHIDPAKLAIANRATKTFEKIFQIDSDAIVLKNEASILSIESEVLDLSTLYGWQGEQNKQLTLLKSLVHLQEEHADWKWNAKSQALYALGNAYEDNAYSDQALDCYRQLLSTQKSSDSYVYSASKLHYARLSFASLSLERKTIQDPEVQTILNYLKDLQIRKKLTQEPLHLEAAIDYADLRSSLENNERQDLLFLQLLNRAKEDFTSKEGICAKDYESSRQRYPEKNRLYQAYVMLMDAHIARLEAKIAGKEGKDDEKRQKQEAAKALYLTLVEGEFAVTHYVTQQAQLGLEQIEASCQDSTSTAG